MRQSNVDHRHQPLGANQPCHFTNMCAACVDNPASCWYLARRNRSVPHAVAKIWTNNGASLPRGLPKVPDRVDRCRVVGSGEAPDADADGLSARSHPDFLIIAIDDAPADVRDGDLCVVKIPLTRLGATGSASAKLRNSPHGSTGRARATRMAKMSHSRSASLPQRTRVRAVVGNQ